MTFSQLKIGQLFRITDLRACYHQTSRAMRKTRPGKWTPTNRPRWCLDYQAVRVDPKFDEWDRQWPNSDYLVEPV